MLHVNGTSNAGGSKEGMIIASLNGIIAEQAIHFNFKILNNETKYEALLVDLRLSHELRIQCLKILRDSQLVLGHVCREYKAKAPTMEKYLEMVK